MTVPEASKLLNMSPQLIRVWIQSGKCPFGVILANKTRKTYYINQERMKLWCEGRL